MEVNSLQDLFVIFQRPSTELIKILQNSNLIRSEKRCASRQCRRYCKLYKDEGSTLGYRFGCSKCRKPYALLEGSFFSNMKVKMNKVFYLLWLWASECPSRVAINILNMKRHLVCKQFRCFRAICSWKLLNTPGLFQLGGEEQIVQICEGVLIRRKSDVDGTTLKRWLIAVYCPTTKRGLVKYIESRNREYVTSVIMKYVLPGTEIWSDSSESFNSLSCLNGVSPYVHKTSHATNTCMNEVRGYLGRVKQYMSHLNVLQSNLLPEYLDQYMWKEHFGSSAKERFDNLLLHISEKYSF